ncbi:MAG TPA: hypothetical protein VF079_03100 [Sphingomicrobium sp.]
MGANGVTMERPAEVVWFERIMLGTLALGVLQTWLGWSKLVQMSTPAFALTTEIVTVAIIGGLTLRASRGHSNIAKWILVALALIGFPFVAMALENGDVPGSPVITVIQTVAQLVALVLLFTSGGKSWFKPKAAEA